MNCSVVGGWLVVCVCARRRRKLLRCHSLGLGLIFESRISSSVFLSRLDSIANCIDVSLGMLIHAFRIAENVCFSLFLVSRFSVSRSVRTECGTTETNVSSKRPTHTHISHLTRANGRQKSPTDNNTKVISRPDIIDVRSRLN